MQSNRRERHKLAYPITLLLALVMMAAACSTGDSIPDNLKASTDALEDRIEETRGNVDRLESEYEDSLDTARYRFIADYSAEERHADRFDQARTALSEANDVRENRVNELTDGYNSDEQQALAEAVRDAENLIDEAQRLAEDPAAWLDLVVATSENPSGTVTEAETAAAAAAEDFAAIDGIVAVSKESFPEEASRFNELMAPLNELRDATASAVPALQTEAALPSPNFAVMTTHAETARTGQETAQSKLDELTRTETQTLIDVRVDSSVVIERVTWDNDVCDYNCDHTREYQPVAVSAEAANHFAQYANGDKIAEWERDGDHIKLMDDSEESQGYWAELNLDPNEVWGQDGDDGGHDGDDDGEFYLGEVIDVPCHQILRLVNGEPDSSTRPDADSDPCSQYDTPADLADGIYWEEGDGVRTADIGMDVYSKGYGLFADQATEAASPPGMAYVGNEQCVDENGEPCGEWDDNGTPDDDSDDFWVFYGRYRFYSDLLGGGPFSPYHYRYEYDAWNQGYRYSDRSYYAGTDNERRYGGLSPYASTRFGGSSGYGQSYNSTGLADATVRGSGPVARGGGPGGGGK